LLNEVPFFGILEYGSDIVIKSSRSLSHLLMSSCYHIWCVKNGKNRIKTFYVSYCHNY